MRLSLAMWVTAVTAYQPLIDNAATLLLFITIVKLKSCLCFSTSQDFIFICIPLYSATTRGLDSSTEEVRIGKGGLANLYGKSVVRGTSFAKPWASSGYENHSQIPENT